MRNAGIGRGQNNSSTEEVERNGSSPCTDEKEYQDLKKSVCASAINALLLR
jgi:hypothetical protein